MYITWVLTFLLFLPHPDDLCHISDDVVMVTDPQRGVSREFSLLRMLLSASVEMTRRLLSSGINSRSSSLLWSLLDSWSTSVAGRSVRVWCCLDGATLRIGVSCGESGTDRVVSAVAGKWMLAEVCNTFPTFALPSCTAEVDLEITMATAPSLTTCQVISLAAIVSKKCPAIVLQYIQQRIMADQPTDQGIASSGAAPSCDLVVTRLLIHAVTNQRMTSLACLLEVCLLQWWDLFSVLEEAGILDEAWRFVLASDDPSDTRLAGALLHSMLQPTVPVTAVRGFLRQITDHHDITETLNRALCTSQRTFGEEQFATLCCHFPISTSVILSNVKCRVVRAMPMTSSEAEVTSSESAMTSSEFAMTSSEAEVTSPVPSSAVRPEEEAGFEMVGDVRSHPQCILALSEEAKRRGSSLLHETCRYGNSDLLSELLVMLSRTLSDSSDVISVWTSVVDEEGRSPLLYACWSGCMETMRLLVDFLDQHSLLDVELQSERSALICTACLIGENAPQLQAYMSKRLKSHKRNYTLGRPAVSVQRLHLLHFLVDR